MQNEKVRAVYRTSAARRQHNLVSFDQLRLANAISSAIIVWCVGGLTLYGRLKGADLWPGWLGFSLPVLFVAGGLAWLVAGTIGEGKLRVLLWLQTVLIAGVVALEVLWLTLVDLGVAFGMELGPAYRFGMYASLVAAAITALIVVFRGFPNSMPSILALELAAFTFGVTAAGVGALLLSLAKPLIAIPSDPARFASIAVGLGVTHLLASRGFIIDQTRDLYRFGATWLPALAGSLFAASIAVHLLFPTALRTAASDERLLLSVNNGVGFAFLFLAAWILILSRHRTAVSWACMAAAALTSVYMVADARQDRSALSIASEQARRAGFASRSQDYREALRGWQEVLEIREQALPSSHQLVAEALAGKGNALYGLGRHNEVIEPLTMALRIAEISNGDAGLESKLLRAKIALSLQNLGRFGEANSVLAPLEVSELLNLPTGEFELGWMLASVGDVYRKVGRFDDAELLYRRSLEAVNEAQLRDHDSIYLAKSGLARLLIATGRYEEARVLLRDLVLQMSHKFRPLFMSDCYQLEAEIDGSLDRFSSAARLQKQALRILVDDLGRNHPDTAAALRDLGTYLIGAGAIDQALEACKTARDILASALGEESPETSKADFALGCALAAAGRHREAAALLEKSIQRWLTIYGEDFFLLSEARLMLARVSAEMGDHEAASDLFASSLESAIEHFTESLATLSEQQQVAALHRLQQRHAEFLLHTIDSRVNDPVLVRRSFDGWLRTKGVLLEAQRLRGEMLARGASEEAREIERRVRAINSELASLWFEGRVDREGRTQAAALQEERQKLDTWLNKLLADSGFWASNTTVTLSTLEGRLPGASTFIDFFWARSGVGEDRYLAFVLPSWSRQGPELVDLGPARVIDQLVVEYLGHLAEGLGLKSDPRMVALGHRLYNVLMTPLLPALEGSRSILISPDGALARLPFGALIQPSGEYLDQRFQISYLSSGRDVVLWDKPFDRKRSAIVFADPNFDWVAPRSGSADGIDGPQRRRPGSWRAPPFRNVYLQRLPGTRVEAEGIARLLEKGSNLDVLLFTDLSASEESLQFVESPWLMHLATHGYFVPPDQLVPPENVPASMILLGTGGLRANPDDNPSARAGLALTGANAALREGHEWGLLTLDEITAMPLVDTEMVVVSACESGVGEVGLGEGVFGVGRAFLAAGSRSVVVTLWSVADEPTARLMQDFYALWLSGETKAEALRHAQDRLRRNHPSPAIWAPFILVGDPS